MRLFTLFFTLLLVYVIAALLFWGFSLEKQSGQIYQQEERLLMRDVDQSQYPQLYDSRRQQLEAQKTARTKQFFGEGITFLCIILAGAGVVYSSYRRNIGLSKQQNNFMLSVTHELKSPLAAVKLNLQTLERPQLTDAQRQLLISRSIREADRLDELCTNMLVASQMDGGQYAPNMEGLDLSAMLNDTMKVYEMRYPGRFHCNIEKEKAVTGDAWLLQMAIHNLLENALKYTPGDTAIDVRLTDKGNDTMLQVADGGPGIPDAEKKKIFSKFYRIGDEGTRKAKGTGLGLYITAGIIRRHGGSVAVHDNMPHGAVFELCLPAQQENDKE